MMMLFSAFVSTIVSVISLFNTLWYWTQHAAFIYGVGQLCKGDDVFLSRNNTRLSLFFVSKYLLPNFTFYVSTALVSLYGTRMLWLMGKSFWYRNDEDDEGYYDEEEQLDSSYFYTVLDEYPIEEPLEIPTECELYPKKSKPKLESYYSPGRRLRREMMYNNNNANPSPPPSPTMYPAPSNTTFQSNYHDPVFNKSPPRTTAPVAVTPPSPPRAASATPPPLRGILRHGRGGRRSSNNTTTVRKTAQWSYTVQVREYGIRMGDVVGLCPQTTFSDLPVEFSDEIVQDSSFELMIEVVKNTTNKVPFVPLEREEKVERLKKWGIVAPPKKFFFPTINPGTYTEHQEASEFCGADFSAEKEASAAACLKARKGFVQERRQNPNCPWMWHSMEQWQNQFGVAGWRQSALFYGKHQERLAQLPPLERVANGTGRVMFRKRHGGASCSTRSTPVATGKRGRSDDDATVCHATRRRLLQ